MEICPNPLGRPLGGRTRLSEAFLKDIVADWEGHGAKAIKDFREERPHDYVKLVASLLPKNFNIKVNELDDLTDEQLQQQYDAVVAEIERIERAEREGKDPEAVAEPTLLLPGPQ